MASNSAWVRVRKSKVRGRYWRSSPLVFSLHPRCHGPGVTEVDLDTGLLGEPDVLGHLVALVPGQGPGQRRREGGDLRRQRVGDQIRLVAAGQRDQHHEPGRAFHQRGDRGHAFAEDQVALPVPRHSPVVCFGGAFGDVEDPGPATTPIGQPGPAGRRITRPVRR